MISKRIAAVIEAAQSGHMFIIADDVHRENEGDIVIPAQAVTKEHIAFMAKKASGLICVAMAGSLLDRLDLPLMEHRNRDSLKTAFTLTVDATHIHGITTGISAAERALTIRLLSQEMSTASDFVCPGHVFPLRAHKEGILGRSGHTEAAVEIMNLGNLKPAAVICEIMNDHGEMIRGEALDIFSKEHDLPMIHIYELIAYKKMFLRK